MKINSKVLFFGRKNDTYSKIVESFLKKKFTNVKSVWINKQNKKKSFKKNFFKVDILISFRSYYIFKPREIGSIKKIAINFHPGPPKYRGYGCANYAIYNDDKKYGVTSHLINSKIDSGEILNVKYFKINKKISLNDLLKLTYVKQIVQIKNLINSLIKYDFNLSKYKKYFPNNEKWSKILGTKKKLDKFYIIDRNVNKKKLIKKIRSTYTFNYRPYINIFNKKFYYNGS